MSLFVNIRAKRGIDISLATFGAKIQMILFKLGKFGNLNICAKIIRFAVARFARVTKKGDHFNDFNPLCIGIFIPCLELRVLVKPLGFLFLLPCTILWSRISFTIILVRKKSVFLRS